MVMFVINLIKYKFNKNIYVILLRNFKFWKKLLYMYGYKKLFF